MIDPDGILWQTSNSGNPSPPADSPPNAAWVNDPAVISDKHLDSPPIAIDFLENAELTFRNNYGLQNTFDGGVLEVSIDGGPFQDILAAGGSFDQAATMARSAPAAAIPLVVVMRGRVAPAASSRLMWVSSGHTIVLRWRMGTDSSVSGQGWRIDTVQIVCERPTPTATPTAATTATATARQHQVRLRHLLLRRLLQRPQQRLRQLHLLRHRDRHRRRDSRQRLGRVPLHRRARSWAWRSIAPTLARGRCDSGLRRTFPCSRPCRCGNDRAFRRSDRNC